MLNLTELVRPPDVTLSVWVQYLKPMFLSRRSAALSAFQFSENQALNFMAENEVGKSNSARGKPPAFGGLCRAGVMAIPAVDISKGLDLLEK